MQKMCSVIVCPDDDQRSELGLTLESAEWEKSAKGTQRNLELSVECINEHGKTLNDAIRTDCLVGKKKKDTVESAVICRSNSPKWNEAVSIFIPQETAIDKLCKIHIRLLLRHCSGELL